MSLQETLAAKIKAAEVVKIDIPDISAVMDVPEQELPKGYHVVTHPYNLLLNKKRFIPDIDGMYHFDNDEEEAALKHWVSKGFIGFRE